MGWATCLRWEFNQPGPYKDLICVRRWSDARCWQVQCREPKKGQQKVQFYYEDEDFAHLGPLLFIYLGVLRPVQMMSRGRSSSRHNILQLLYTQWVCSCYSVRSFSETGQPKTSRVLYCSFSRKGARKVSDGRTESQQCFVDSGSSYISFFLTVINFGTHNLQSLRRALNDFETITSGIYRTGGWGEIYEPFMGLKS